MVSKSIYRHSLIDIKLINIEYLNIGVQKSEKNFDFENKKAPRTNQCPSYLLQRMVLPLRHLNISCLKSPSSTTNLYNSRKVKDKILIIKLIQIPKFDSYWSNSNHE